ncbi:hypothetical protein FOWG_10432 [Fusarium oxysporum f. sp. lycopersici MN25]|nr:hypothetical protein FOWG_10432 [Fusarium oxysporum f. sp. lycopersici MN25]
MSTHYSYLQSRSWVAVVPNWTFASERQRDHEGHPPPIRGSSETTENQLEDVRPQEDLEVGVVGLQDELRPSSEAQLLVSSTPYRVRPPRRKVVWIWFCCCCGHGGMKVSVDPCPRCGVPRCPNCDTQRYNTRS